MGCRHATVLDASPEEVWSALRDFHDLSWSSDVVEHVETVGDKEGTEEGARRVINGAFHETLLELDDENRSLRYRVDEAPGPLQGVEGYVGFVRVVPVTAPADSDQTVVVWGSDWTPGQNGIREFCDPLYAALLDDLKAHFG